MKQSPSKQYSNHCKRLRRQHRAFGRYIGPYMGVVPIVVAVGVAVSTVISSFGENEC